MGTTQGAQAADYAAAMRYINDMGRLGSRPGLESIRELTRRLGDPQEKLRFVHVAGTNGKGSAVAFVSSVLTAAGYRTGVYISPYIQRFSERIRVNEAEIGEADIARITNRIRPLVEAITAEGLQSPTQFDIVTALALVYYAEQKCDVVVLEVGLGGRLDSTNVIPAPAAAVITNIGYDHMEILGDTLEKIAFEKAGIIKRGCDVVLYPQQPGVDEVFASAAKERGARLFRVRREDIRPVSDGLAGQEFDFEERRGLKVPLLGQHQLLNAAVAVKTTDVLRAKGYAISEDALRKGLAGTKWPGRMELLQKQPPFLIDGAHNVQGVTSLALGLKRYFPGRPVTFLTGVLADKEYKEMMALVSPLAARFVVITPESPRALPAEELAAHLARYGKPVAVCGSVPEAVEESRAQAGDGVVCAFGSLYFIGLVRDYFGLE